ncbi:MAG TPA: hypothetical protein VIL69_08000 [Roseomonas sp.]|jgi:hypothetical protein
MSRDWDGLPEGSPKALRAAVDAYRAAFGAQHLPDLFSADPDIAVWVLTKAVMRGRPVRRYLISRMSGSWRGPPPARMPGD